MTSTLQKLKVKNIYAELSLFFIFQTWPKFIFNHFFMIVRGHTYFLVHYTLSDFLHFTFLVKFYFGEFFLITLSSYFSLVKTTHAFSIWFVIHRGLLLQISFLSQIQNSFTDHVTWWDIGYMQTWQREGPSFICCLS